MTQSTSTTIQGRQNLRELVLHICDAVLDSHIDLGYLTLKGINQALEIMKTILKRAELGYKARDMLLTSIPAQHGDPHLGGERELGPRLSMLR